ncbi:MAG TPA: TrmH family RNA methyltransferase, partial [Longimicrobiales bacterium]|nr:TrmH family RNA methyltransferase [Longimicrobiales bacterium]
MSETPWADRFVVVLNETQDIVNIAGAMRAMMNMGFSRLRLVKPALFDAYRIAGIAHGSEPYLERVQFFDTLDDALADVTHSIGTTARWRTSQFVWRHPRDAAPELLKMPATIDQPIALVFGREDTGLTTEQIDRLDSLITVPTNPQHPSLNLHQAVLLITYELRMAALEESPALPTSRRTAEPATTAELNAMFDDIETSLGIIDFFKKRQPQMIMRTVRASARRAQLNQREA